MEYTTDIYGKDILLQNGKNEQVMMEWEIPYMNALIDNVKPTDMDVLEIGYGMGYSAKRIQSYKPKSHTIIERDKTVIKRAKEDGLNINIIKDTWQNALYKLGKFDFIFMDDHSYEDWDDEIEKAIDCNRHNLFADMCIYGHLNDNGMISFYFNGEEFNSHKYVYNRNVTYTEKSIDIEIPDNCQYRKCNKCIVPLIQYRNFS